MRKFDLLRATSVIVIGLSAAATSAQEASADLPAQPKLTAGTAADAGLGLEQIVVTGSRLNRVNADSAVPITTLTAGELLSTGNLSLGDTLSQLPQLRATFTSANSTRNIGTAGISALDLRGQGTARTLVLTDGRRIITATPGINRPDVNDVPEDLIDRVDIVTGGNSAIYGSDAVAGVVNFVLKQNFEGLRIRAQGGVSSRGDTGSYLTTITAGHSFREGRGNIAASAEFSHESTLTNIERDGQTGAFSGRNQFNAVENIGSNLNPSAGPLHPAQPQNGDGIIDTAFFNNIFNNSISEGGLFTAICPNAAAAGETAAAFARRRGVACSGLANPASANPLAQFGTTFVFNPDGSLVKNPCSTDFRPYGSSNCVGGLGSSLRRSGYLQPGVERKALTILGHYEISPAFVPYFSAKYVHVDANQEGQPTFFNNTFSVNNPFLTTQARNALLSVLAPGQTTFTAQRFDIDFGGRGELHTRENYQAVGGVRGVFNGDWKYDVSFNYGRTNTFYRTQGNILRAQYANSLNATRNAAGQIVCAINAVTVTDPGCVPVNLFGDGQVSQAALNYFGYTSSRIQRAELFDGLGYISGNSSQFLNLPGGPIAFVIGGEIRRETAFAAYDSITSDPRGLTFLNVIPNFAPPAEVVKEGFFEVSAPLLKDLPFVKELRLDGDGRVTNYNIGATGTVFTFSGNAIYSPVRDIRFRAGFARSIRAPTQQDLYGSASQTFLNNAIDPCGQQNINQNPNRRANCLAAGVPTTQTFTVGGITSTEPFSNRAQSGISGFNGANPTLSAEKSNSLTIGAVVEPRYVPGLSISLDYYRIAINNVINTLLPQTIINQCYDSTTGINNPFCAVVFRNPNGTFKGQSDVAHAGAVVSFPTTGQSFIAGPFNYARQVTSGLDIDVGYRRTFANDWQLTLRSIATHTFVRTNYTNISDPNFGLRQLSLLGDPEWQAQISANLIMGEFNLGYRVRYIGHQILYNNGANQYETQNVFQGRQPLNIEAFPFVYYPDISYHDFRIDIAPKNTPYKFYVGVDNAFDQLPPYDLLGTENGDPFSPVGRFIYAGVTLKF